VRKQLDKTTLDILRDGSEKQLAELDMPWPDSEDELRQIINAVLNRGHDYGTCVYAMSIAGEAAFNFVARKLGVTGFQASCADMDILRRTRRIKGGFALLDYENLLYPQYRERFDELTWERLLVENKEWLREKAGVLLAENSNAHPNVRSHWERLAAA
jgi:hypothetical protein